MKVKSYGLIQLLKQDGFTGPVVVGREATRTYRRPHSGFIGTSVASRKEIAHFCVGARVAILLKSFFVENLVCRMVGM